MKSFLLFCAFFFLLKSSEAQTGQVTSLPTGKYETVLKNNQKWDKGDIILIDDNKYRTTSSGETGEYRFSVSAQRIFFISGPLKGVFAKTNQTHQGPAIFIPVAENVQIGLKQASADIAGYHRQ